MKNHSIDDEERLSDADSDVLEMEQTLKELRQTKLEFMSRLPTINDDETMMKYPINSGTTTIDLNKISVADVSSTIRKFRAANRSIPPTYGSYEMIPNAQMMDSGHWPNTMLSTRTNNANSSLMYQTLNRYPSTLSQTNPWGSQPTLVTREAVIKAARKVFAPSVIDKLTTNTRSSTY